MRGSLTGLITANNHQIYKFYALAGKADGKKCLVLTKEKSR
jgi:hypothetical protein